MPFQRTGRKDKPLMVKKGASKTFYARAFRAGVLGAVVISLVTWVAVLLRFVPVDIEIMLGSLLVGDTGSLAWSIGFIWHLLNGGLFGLVYGFFLDMAGSRAQWWFATLFGVPHWFVSGFFLGWLQLTHPMTMEAAPPGLGIFFWLQFSPGLFAGSLALHLLFGTVVGAITVPKLRQVWC